MKPLSLYIPAMATRDVLLVAFILALAASVCLAATESAALRRSAVPLAAESGVAAEQGAGTEGDGTESGRNHFVRWVGHFHPPLTAFPIAMLLGAALAELLRLLSKAVWLEGASRWCVMLGGIGAAFTAPLGWAFAIEHEHSWVLEAHRWLGTAAGCGALVILFLSEMGRRPNRARWLAAFRIVLFLAVPLVLATGFFGGAMVYGLHAYNWSSPEHH